MSEGQSELSSNIPQVTIYGRTYEEMDAVVRDCFASLGKTKADGFLNFSEFKLVLKTLNVPFTEPRAYLWFDLADFDGSGEIEYEEFQHLLYMVSLCEPSNSLIFRDIYYFLTNDRELIRSGVGEWARLRSEYFPDADAFIIQCILATFGINLSLSKVERIMRDALVKLSKDREREGKESRDLLQEAIAAAVPGAGISVPYSVVKDIFVSRCDVRSQLIQRDLDPTTLQYNGSIPNQDTSSLQRYFREYLDAEDREIEDAILAILIQAEEDRKKLRLRQEEGKREHKSIGRREDKSVRRAKALLDRAERLRAAREEEAAKQRAEEEASLREAVISAALERDEAERHLKSSAVLSFASEVESGSSTGPAAASDAAGAGLQDVLDLSSRGLMYLPSLLWGSADARKRLGVLKKLDLSNNKLVQLPARSLLFQTPLLLLLDASGNALEALPDDLGELGRLRLLRLGANRLASLPPSIGLLSSLRSLRLEGNRLETLPDEICQLTNLEVLRVDQNRLVSLPEALGQLRQLRELSASGNRLEYVPDSVGELQALQTLELGHNQLRALPSSVSLLRQLRVLRARGNHLRTLPSKLGKLKRLQLLDAGMNSLKRLPESLGRLDSLLSLELDRNSLLEVPEDSLRHLVSLQRLNLSSNRLASLPHSLGRLMSLQLLDCADNLLRSLPASIAACAQLRHLRLRGNRLGEGAGRGADCFPPSSGSLAGLEWLDLSSCGLQVLPTALPRCPALQHLVCRENELTEFPAWLCDCALLVSLDLSGNRMPSIPPAVSQLARLEALDLSCNLISVLPVTIAECESLRHLHLYNNRLQQLPASLAWLLPQLQSFDVALNPLRGLPQKWAAASVTGARDALGVRFSRPRRDPLVARMRAARARDLFSRLEQLRANEEDRVDRERSEMLRADTRAQQRMLERGRALLLLQRSACASPRCRRRLIVEHAASATPTASIAVSPHSNTHSNSEICTCKVEEDEPVPKPLLPESLLALHASRVPRRMENDPSTYRNVEGSGLQVLRRRREQEAAEREKRRLQGVDAELLAYGVGNEDLDERKAYEEELSKRATIIESKEGLKSRPHGFKRELEAPAAAAVSLIEWVAFMQDELDSVYGPGEPAGPQEPHAETKELQIEDDGMPALEELSPEHIEEINRRESERRLQPEDDEAWAARINVRVGGSVASTAAPSSSRPVSSELRLATNHSDDGSGVTATQTAAQGHEELPPATVPIVSITQLTQFGMELTPATSDATTAMTPVKSTSPASPGGVFTASPPLAQRQRMKRHVKGLAAAAAVAAATLPPWLTQDSPAYYDAQFLYMLDARNRRAQGLPPTDSSSTPAARVDRTPYVHAKFSHLEKSLRRDPGRLKKERRARELARAGRPVPAGLLLKTSFDAEWRALRGVPKPSDCDMVLACVPREAELTKAAASADEEALLDRSKGYDALFGIRDDEEEAELEDYYQPKVSFQTSPSSSDGGRGSSPAHMNYSSKPGNEGGSVPASGSAGRSGPSPLLFNETNGLTSRRASFTDLLAQGSSSRPESGGGAAGTITLSAVIPAARPRTTSGFNSGGEPASSPVDPRVAALTSLRSELREAGLIPAGVHLNEEEREQERVVASLVVPGPANREFQGIWEAAVTPNGDSPAVGAEAADGGIRPRSRASSIVAATAALERQSRASIRGSFAGALGIGDSEEGGELKAEEDMKQGQKKQQFYPTADLVTSTPKASEAEFSMSAAVEGSLTAGSSVNSSLFLPGSRLASLGGVRMTLEELRALSLGGAAASADAPRQAWDLANRTSSGGSGGTPSGNLSLRNAPVDSAVTALVSSKLADGTASRESKNALIPPKGQVLRVGPLTGQNIRRLQYLARVAAEHAQSATAGTALQRAKELENAVIADMRVRELEIRRSHTLSGLDLPVDSAALAAAHLSFQGTAGADAFIRRSKTDAAGADYSAIISSAAFGSAASAPGSVVLGSLTGPGLTSGRFSRSSEPSSSRMSGSGAIVTTERKTEGVQFAEDAKDLAAARAYASFVAIGGFEVAQRVHNVVDLFVPGATEAIAAGDSYRSEEGLSGAFSMRFSSGAGGLKRRASLSGLAGASRTIAALARPHSAGRRGSSAQMGSVIGSLAQKLHPDGVQMGGSGTDSMFASIFAASSAGRRPSSAGAPSHHPHALTPSHSLGSFGLGLGSFVSTVSDVSAAQTNSAVAADASRGSALVASTGAVSDSTPTPAGSKMEYLSGLEAPAAALLSLARSAARQDFQHRARHAIARAEASEAKEAQREIDLERARIRERMRALGAQTLKSQGSMSGVRATSAGGRRRDPSLLLQSGDGGSVLDARTQSHERLLRHRSSASLSGFSNGRARPGSADTARSLDSGSRGLARRSSAGSLSRRLSTGSLGSRTSSRLSFVRARPSAAVQGLLEDDQGQEEDSLSQSQTQPEQQRPPLSSGPIGRLFRAMADAMGLRRRENEGPDHLRVRAHARALAQAPISTIPTSISASLSATAASDSAVHLSPPDLTSGMDEDPVAIGVPGVQGPLPLWAASHPPTSNPSSTTTVTSTSLNSLPKSETPLQHASTSEKVPGVDRITGQVAFPGILSTAAPLPALPALSSVLRTDAYVQDSLPLEYSSQEMRREMPRFGQFAPLKASVSASKSGARSTQAPEGLLDGPEGVTGISLRRTSPGDTPASESLVEKRILHVRRLERAAAEARRLRFLGGVKFIEDPGLYFALRDGENDEDDTAYRTESASEALVPTLGSGDVQKGTKGSSHVHWTFDVSPDAVSAPPPSSFVHVGAGSTGSAAQLRERRNSFSQFSTHSLSLSQSTQQTNLARPAPASGRPRRSSRAGLVSFGSASDLGGSSAPSPSSESALVQPIDRSEAPPSAAILPRFDPFVPSQAEDDSVFARKLRSKRGSLASAANGMAPGVAASSLVVVNTTNGSDFADLQQTAPGVASKAQLALQALQYDSLQRQRLRQATLTRGFTSQDAAEALLLQASFVLFAEAEWLERGGAYLSGHLGSSDFLKFVRRRMMRLDPLSAAPLPADPSLNESSQARWDPLLAPLVRSFFCDALRTGIPPSLRGVQLSRRLELLGSGAAQRAQRAVRDAAERVAQRQLEKALKEEELVSQTAGAEETSLEAKGIDADTLIVGFRRVREERMRMNSSHGVEDPETADAVADMTQVAAATMQDIAAHASSVVQEAERTRREAQVQRARDEQKLYAGLYSASKAELEQLRRKQDFRQKAVQRAKAQREIEDLERVVSSRAKIQEERAQAYEKKKKEDLMSKHQRDLQFAMKRAEEHRARERQQAIELGLNPDTVDSKKIKLAMQLKALK